MAEYNMIIVFNTIQIAELNNHIALGKRIGLLAKQAHLFNDSEEITVSLVQARLQDDLPKILKFFRKQRKMTMVPSFLLLNN